jgi:beta-glucosidase
VLFFGGLTKFYESEGFDRTHMRMPDNQLVLLDKLSKLGKKIIVILYGGAPVEMPWIGSASEVLNMYLPGEAVGEATLDVLTGKVNPSGKLSESYPLKFTDNPSYNYFPEGPVTSEYRESIFVGYRYYNTAGVSVLFPFGHGLSYTEFKYSDIKLDKKELKAPYGLKVFCKVTNTGKRDGKEIVQLYIRKKNSVIHRADRELKGFIKLTLESGKSGKAEFILDDRAFSYYNVKTGEFEVEGGEYEILIGASSLDIRLSAIVTVEGTGAPIPYTEDTIGEYKAFKGKVSDNAYSEVLGRSIPFKAYEIKPIRLDTITAEARVTPMGKLLYFGLNKGVYFAQRGKDVNAVLMRKFMRDLMSVSTMRSLANSNGGMLSLGMVDGLITIVNGKICKGIRQIMKARKFNKEWDRKLLEIEDWDYKKL